MRRTRVAWLPKSLSALVVCLLATAAFATEPPKPLTAGYYNESVLNEKPIDGNRPAVDPTPYINGTASPGLDYGVRLRTGMSYFDVPTDSRVGGTYGATGAVRLFGGLAAQGSANVNHFSGGSQFYGSAGLVKVSTACDEMWVNRIGYAVMFDYLNDSRLGGLESTQLRLRLSYALGQSTRVGAIYTEPINVTSANVVIAPGTTDTFDLQTTRGIMAYVTQDVGSVSLTALAGYREDPHTSVLGGQVRIPLNDDWSAVGSATYQDIGFWTSFVGMEYAFGSPRSRTRCGGCCRREIAVPVVSSEPTHSIVRGGDQLIGSVGVLIWALAGGQSADWWDDWVNEPEFDISCLCNRRPREGRSFAVPVGTPGG